MSFTAPARKIFAPQHVAAFKHSTAYKNITAFILAVNESVKGKAATVAAPTNEVRRLTPSCQYNYDMNTRILFTKNT